MVRACGGLERPRCSSRGPMHVLAINQFYAPDHSATAQLLTELCEDMARAGDRVTVVASRGSYLGGERWPGQERFNGVDVIRPPSTSFGKATLLHRMGDYSSFWLGSVAAALQGDRPDVVLALTTPPMIAAGGALTGALRRVPLVTWVQDVYPDIAGAFGVLNPRSLPYQLLARLMREALRRSSAVVALSAGMKERLRNQGVRAAAIEVIPNWSDGALIRPIPKAENSFRREHGLGDHFVAMYSGNLGVGHDFKTFVAAARILKETCPRALLLFVGDGSRRAEAERVAAGLRNVRFLPYQPRDRLGESLSAADLHLISLRENLDGLLVPSKLYGAMASARPILYVGPASCEVARALATHGCGVAFRPGDAEGVADAIARMCNDADGTERQGASARSAFEAHYERRLAVAAWRRVLSEAAAVRQPR